MQLLNEMALCGNWVNAVGAVSLPLVYELSPDAEQLFPKAYVPILRQLLEVLSEEMTKDEVEVLLRRTGRRLAEQQHASQGDLQERLLMAVNVLNELGGLTELQQRNGAYCIQGYSCPLAAGGAGPSRSLPSRRDAGLGTGWSTGEGVL